MESTGAFIGAQWRALNVLEDVLDLGAQRGGERLKKDAALHAIHTARGEREDDANGDLRLHRRRVARFVLADSRRVRAALYTRRVALLFRSLSSSLVMLALTFVARMASAQCEMVPQAPTAVTPATGAQDVTTDAWVMARFSPGYFGPMGPGDDPTRLVVLESCGSCESSCTLGSGRPVAGEVQVLQDDLFFLPNQPLTSHTRYVGRVDGLEGSIPISFCTGFSPDAFSPFMTTRLDPDSVSVGESCELENGGYRIGVYMDPASDDGPSGSLEYMLFQTRGDGITAPVLVDRVRNFAVGEITMRIFLARERAATPICVIAAVMDGVGRLTFQDDETCFDPVTKVTFQGCSISRSQSTHVAWLAFSAALLLTWRAKRRGVRAHRQSSR